MTITNQEIIKFQNEVFSFYHSQGRSLPWRKTTDPYKILLSEYMLQQTQVSRVIHYYEKWITKWPTIIFLAGASRKNVLQAWMGLGYNSRGINLHRAAQKIVDDYDGDVVQAMKHYKDIPGVGKYTSRAVQIFATNADIVTVDTNIRRILIYRFQLAENIPDTELWTLAEQCLPHGSSRDWHNALMDYGALFLTSKKTGIPPKTKQLRFQGSDRQIRAKILRQLINQPLSSTDISKKYDVDPKRLELIIDKMVKQTLIVKKNNCYYINEK
jgi:A/G-specific adenine glycosylase